MYFDELLPEGRPAGTVVLVHGGSLTGACYLSTPDGRPGWAPRFAAHGYRVLVPDWPGTGRSTTLDPDDVTGAVVCAALGRLISAQDGPVVLLVHSMSGPFGFRLLSTHAAHVSALVAVAPGPPGEIQPEPTVLRSTPDELEIQGEFLRWRLPRRGLWWPTEAFARTKMIGSSTRFPPGAFDPFVRSLVPIPAGLLAERQNVGGRQLRTAGPVPATPTLLLTGDHDPDHPRAADAATARRLAALGATVTHHYLGTGNGHLLMSEDNSDELADRIVQWLRDHHR